MGETCCHVPPNKATKGVKDVRRSQQLSRAATAKANKLVKNGKLAKPKPNKVKPAQVKSHTPKAQPPCCQKIKFRRARLKP